MCPFGLQLDASRTYNNVLISSSSWQVATNLGPRPISLFPNGINYSPDPRGCVYIYIHELIFCLPKPSRACASGLCVIILTSIANSEWILAYFAPHNTLIVTEQNSKQKCESDRGQIFARVTNDGLWWFQRSIGRKKDDVGIASHRMREGNKNILFRFEQSRYRYHFHSCCNPTSLIKSRGPRHIQYLSHLRVPRIEKSIYI